MTIRIEGLREFRRDLAGAPKETRTLLGASLKKGAGIVAETGKLEAPVRSGALRASIKPGASSAGGRRGPSAWAGSKLVYSRLIHFGATITRGPAGYIQGPHTIRIKPNPFLDRALEREEDRIMTFVESSLEELLDYIAGAA